MANRMPQWTEEWQNGGERGKVPVDHITQMEGERELLLGKIRNGGPELGDGFAEVSFALGLGVHALRIGDETKGNERHLRRGGVCLGRGNGGGERDELTSVHVQRAVVCGGFGAAKRR